MSFTTQSLSVPLVDATRFTTGAPPTRNGSVQHRRLVGQHIGAAIDKALIDQQPTPPRVAVRSNTGRGTYGTGFAGSEMYSSEPAADFGIALARRSQTTNRNSLVRYSGFDFAAHVGHASGHDFNRSQ